MRPEMVREGSSKAFLSQTGGLWRKTSKLGHQHKAYVRVGDFILLNVLVRRRYGPTRRPETLGPPSFWCRSPCFYVGGCKMSCC